MSDFQFLVRNQFCKGVGMRGVETVCESGYKYNRIDIKESIMIEFP